MIHYPYLQGGKAYREVRDEWLDERAERVEADRLRATQSAEQR
jgi:hypothetical protein